jgi:hypothetical protein
MKKPTRKTRRISARLAASAYQMVEEVSALTGQSVSRVLEHSIENYHQTLVASRNEPWKALQESGLIGSGEDDSDLSSRYKAALAESLDRKHSTQPQKRKGRAK